MIFSEAATANLFRFAQICTLQLEKVVCLNTSTWATRPATLFNLGY